MKKTRLSLYIGMPVFGISSTALGTIWPDLLYVNLIPVLLSIGLADMVRSPKIFVIFLAVVSHVIFWLPIAYGIDQIYGHYARKSQRKRNRDKRKKSRDIFGSRESRKL